MKINWLEYKNSQTGLKIDRINFSGLNLLVGQTGVGKSNILNVICMFKNIANRIFTEEMYNTSITINIDIDMCNYEWHIKFDDKIIMESVIEDEDYNKSIHQVLEEYLLINGSIYIKRTDNVIIYNNNNMFNLSQTMSFINIFENDEEIKKLSSVLIKINTYLMKAHEPKDLPVITSKVLDMYIKSDEKTDFVLQGSWNPFLKLLLLYEKRKNVFDKIESAYLSIFQNVEKLYFDKDDNADKYTLYQKEKYLLTPVNYQNLSSGMYKTLMLLTNMYSSDEENIFLIDEFENSFGVNCINDVTEIINSNADKFQFIITSHHPYIINNIPTENWSIISRRGSLIKAKSAEAFGIGATKHDSFFELINILDYEENLS